MRRPTAALLRSFRDVTIAALLTLLLFELAVRALGLDPGQHMIAVDVQPEQAGNVVYWPMPARYDPDGDGLRGEGIPGPAGATAVALLGDSILFGVRLPGDQRVGALLARDYRVLDTAVPGYATGQMRVALERLVRRRHVDAVVLSFFHNDTASWKRLGGGVYRACVRFRVPVPGLAHFALDAATGWRLYRLSAGFRAISGPFFTADARCQETAEQATLSEVDRIATLCQRLGVRLIIVLMADTRGSWELARHNRPLMHLYGVVETIARARGATVLDALPALSGTPYERSVLDPTGHLRPPGHAVLARLIREALDAPRASAPRGPLRPARVGGSGRTARSMSEPAATR